MRRITKWIVFPNLVTIGFIYYLFWTHIGSHDGHGPHTLEQSKLTGNATKQHFTVNEYDYKKAGGHVNNAVKDRVLVELTLAKTIDRNAALMKLWDKFTVWNYTEAMPSDIVNGRVAILNKGPRLSVFHEILQYDFKYNVTEPGKGAVERNNWNVMMSQSHYKNYTDFQDLKPHQLVNHIPGMIVITIKALFSSAKSGISYVKPGFSLPNDSQALRAYVQANPDTLWLQKGNYHRGIKMVEMNENIFQTKRNGRFFYQEFMSKPFLIENRKFDIGIQGLFTSGQPLRYYVDFGEWNIKFCQHPYNPFDKKDITKYVEQSSFMTVYHVFSLGQYIIYHKMSRKDALLKYLTTQGLNTEALVERMMDAFAEVGYVKDAEIHEVTEQKRRHGGLPNTYRNHNYYEHVRFDVSLDEDLKPWLIEANLCPDTGVVKLNSNRKRESRWHTDKQEAMKLYPNATMEPPTKRRGSAYRRHIDMKNMLVLAGLTDTIKGIDSVASVPDDVIMVDTEVCTAKPDCDNWEQSVCWKCLDDTDKREMKRSVLEHYRRGAYIRAFPKPFRDQSEARKWSPGKDKLFHKLTERTKRSVLWFRLKCLQQSNWCQ